MGDMVIWKLWSLILIICINGSSIYYSIDPALRLFDIYVKKLLRTNILNTKILINKI